MKKLLLLLTIPMLIASCSKDDNDVNQNCGTLLEIRDNGDGGNEELMVFTGCGDGFASAKSSYASYPNVKVFYKGENRSAANYLVASKTSSPNSVYIRYESGSVPDATIQHYEGLGYHTEVKQLTGLENARY